MDKQISHSIHNYHMLNDKKIFAQKRTMVKKIIMQKLYNQVVCKEMFNAQVKNVVLILS